jgi:NurA domain-containing protein
MLDYAKCASALERVAESLFVHNSLEYTVLQGVWQRIVSDPDFIVKVQKTEAPWPIPTWKGMLNAAIPIESNVDPYVALSVDGSQIYPDKHQGVSCYLINIGTVMIAYGIEPPIVMLASEPFIFSGKEERDESMGVIDYVNAQRLEYELQHGLMLARTAYALSPKDVPVIILFDGSLIFWHLDGYDTHDLFLNCYCALLNQFFENKIVCAWYISMPKSKELIHLVWLALCEHDTTQSELYAVVRSFVDTTVVTLFLKPGYRSTIFKNNASVSTKYPKSLHPHFVYIYTEDEIGRIEFPAWIAEDETTVALLVSMVADQCRKGDGYPLVLSEAHEQAVVKGSDREFFYHMIETIGLKYNRRPIVSRKSFKKKSRYF